LREQGKPHKASRNLSISQHLYSERQLPTQSSMQWYWACKTKPTCRASPRQS